MKKLLIASVAAAAFAVGGCASSGNTSIKDETRASMKEKLNKGMTQEQVIAEFGEPMTTGFSDSGNEQWIYKFEQSKSNATNFIPYVGLFKSGSKGTSRQLTILFDGNSLVDRYTMSASDTESSYGIAG